MTDEGKHTIQVEGSFSCLESPVHPNTVHTWLFVLHRASWEIIQVINKIDQCSFQEIHQIIFICSCRDSSSEQSLNNEMANPSARARCPCLLTLYTTKISIAVHFITTEKCLPLCSLIIRMTHSLVLRTSVFRHVRILSHLHSQELPHLSQIYSKDLSSILYLQSFPSAATRKMIPLFCEKALIQATDGSLSVLYHSISVSESIYICIYI